MKRFFRWLISIFRINPKATKTVAEVAAYTLGYKGADRYPRAFNDAAEFIEKMLPFIDPAPSPEDRRQVITSIGEGVINLISDHIQGDPLLEYQARKILDLVYIDVQVGSGELIPEEQAELLLTALPEFVAGVRARQGGK